MDDLGTKSVVSSGGFSEVGAKRVCRKYHGGKCGGGIAVVCPALDEASFFGCRLFMLSQVPGSLKVLAAVEVGSGKHDNREVSQQKRITMEEFRVHQNVPV